MAGQFPPTSTPGTIVGGNTQGYQDAATFANDIAAKTGLDPRVVFAWVTVEGAYPSPPGTGGENFLNLRPYPGDPYKSVSAGGFEQFGSLSDAEAATLRRIGQPFASAIGGSVNTTPRQQIAAIASTEWDAGHYGGPGGPNLRAAYSSLYGAAALDQPTQSADKTKVSPGGTSGGSVTASVPGLSQVEGAVTSITDAIKFIFSYRFLEILGGSALVLVGVIGLMKEVGVSVPVPGPVGKAASA